ncbi:MAG: omptin family outer membrane protease, partial [Desulfuromonadaceae bacterium]|nr:omptin family outer membrane protease [Desulfuromonadaceae bacterium]
KVSVGGGYLTGETEYQIGGRIDYADGSVASAHFPLSELSFPLDSYVIKGQVDIDFAKKWALMFNAETNITEDSGKMEDSDWGVWGGSEVNSLDIYSESDTEMNMLGLEGKLTYKFYQGNYAGNALNPDSGNPDIRFSYTIGLGYKYQKFDFDIYDVHQWYPSAPYLAHDYVGGRVLTYEAEYHIPYLELGMHMSVAKTFEFDLSVAYAPYIDFKDEDQHLLRNMESFSDHHWGGDALMGNLNMLYKFSSHWSLKAEFEALKISSDGRSKTYIDGIWDHTIDQEISSHQYRAHLMLGYTF